MSYLEYIASAHMASYFTFHSSWPRFGICEQAGRVFKPFLTALQTCYTVNIVVFDTILLLLLLPHYYYCTSYYYLDPGTEGVH